MLPISAWNVTSANDCVRAEEDDKRDEAVSRHGRSSKTYLTTRSWNDIPSRRVDCRAAGAWTVDAERSPRVHEAVDKRDAPPVLERKATPPTRIDHVALPTLRVHGCHVTSLYQPCT